MIQRVQSIWLFLAGITILLILIIPIKGIQTGNVDTWIQGSGMFTTTGETTQKVESFMPLTISLVAVGLLCLVNIFNFRNRTLQKRFIWVSMALIVGLSFWITQHTTKLPVAMNKPYFGVGIFLPLMAIIFCGLAARGITKDEQLLKSADRLR
jgi:D-alanyl-lipoteichoic acid acyltransferase DltB (MBOAT superfamily)